MLLVPEAAVVHEVNRRVVISWEEQSAACQNLTKGLKVVLVDGLPSSVAVCGNVTSELEISVSPLLGHITPFVVGLRWLSVW